MRAFDLYATYDRDEAVSIAAAGGGAERLCDDQWVAVPGHLLCFAEIGLATDRPHVETATRFAWVTGKTWASKARLYDGYLPNEAWAGNKQPVQIYLFLRRAGDGGPFTFVGTLAKANPVGSSKDGVHGGWFELAPALTFDVGLRLGAYAPTSLDHATLDAALGRLHERSDTHTWFEALKALVTYWHGTPSAEDGIGVQDLERPLPDALRRWFAYAGRRERVMSGQNFLLAPSEIEHADDPRLIVFYVENQRCYEWATERHGADPEVFGRDGAPAPWQRENARLSQFLVQVCLFEAITCHAPFGGDSGWIDETVAQRVLTPMRRLPCAGLRWLGSSGFYYGGGAFAHVVLQQHEADPARRLSLSFGAKTDGALAFLQSFRALPWDRRAF